MSVWRGTGGRRLAVVAGSLALLSLAMGACAYLVLPDRTQLLGTWVNIETNATLDLADDGTCHVEGLPRGVDEGIPPSHGEPYSGDCTWRLGSDGEQNERGSTVLTISLAGSGDMTVNILRGPELGIRLGSGDRFFEFERALL